MRVLSLFDGMSCGQIALKRLGASVERYYAYEIDKFAIQVTEENFPETIQRGDVTKENFKKYLGGVDLLIGGSPCQGFSFSGKKLNFDDPRSKLFFDYVRALENSKPRFFLLENVKMDKHCEEIISEMLGVSPLEINSNLFSAQNRRRLYWTNIPVKLPIEDRGITLKNIVEHLPENPTFISDTSKTRLANYGVKFLKGDENKARCLAAREYEKNGKQGNYLLVGERIRKLTVTECKRLQTVPEEYVMNVSNTQAYKMLGNGWTVDVIAHILKEAVNQIEASKSQYYQKLFKERPEYLQL